VESLVLYGSAADQILERSAEDFDVVILSTHGRTGPERWVLGSVADRVLRGSHIPVLLVRAPKEPKAR
jgi:nucleotide-binding universal stress UspA family protein